MRSSRRHVTSIQMTMEKKNEDGAGRSMDTSRSSRFNHRHFGAKSRSPSPRIGNGSSVQQLVLSSTSASGILLAAPGYEQYQKSLLEVPLLHAEYGEASSDDLSSEWDSDVPEPPRNNKVLFYSPNTSLVNKPERTCRSNTRPYGTIERETGDFFNFFHM